jgi:hypothetical protein
MKERTEAMTDPWSALEKPSRGSGVSARRVDVDHPFDFFWGTDLHGTPLFIFEYSSEVSYDDRRPRLKEIRIFEPPPDGARARFIMELCRVENREIFHHLCLDILESTRECPDQKAALATLVRRTWRWHAMLKGARDGRLSPESQKGLIGELCILERVMLRAFEPWSALEFWRGPEGATKDFSAGSVGIESKARRGSASPFVVISSESQLDREMLRSLFLAVTNVDEGSAGMLGALTLDQHVARIADDIYDRASGALGYFESRLAEAGYSEDDDYSDYRWVAGDTRWYRVTDRFPCISVSQLPPGVRDVSYRIDLATCSEWEETESTVLEELQGGQQ